METSELKLSATKPAAGRFSFLLRSSHSQIKKTNKYISERFLFYILYLYSVFVLAGAGAELQPLLAASLLLSAGFASPASRCERSETPKSFSAFPRLHEAKLEQKRPDMSHSATPLVPLNQSDLRFGA